MEGGISKAKAYLIPIVITIIMGIVFFLPAGSFLFWEAWVYLAITFAFLVFIATYFLKRDPELLRRRSQTREREPQKVLIRILSLLWTIGFIIPGLDYRYHWSTVPVWLVIASDVFVILGFVIIFLVFKENSYTSTIIQVEDKQQVITTGPYAVVRHPMYVGLILVSIFTPLALGSYWALITFVLIIPMNLSRIVSEEKVLLRDLPGYKDYCLHTRYRLIPSIW